MQSLFPYQPQNYRPAGPATWDRYYPADPVMFDSEEPEQGNVSSGLAAGITIAIFFLVFIFTFGCRIYSEYVDRTSSGTSRSRDIDYPCRTGDNRIDGCGFLDLRRASVASSPI
ncbi:hypothetical protein PFISCL1PPCAC_143 [Pristionchus fissidentatus]|uniref:Uncharacterized protein n=1 Tax=Pristionchus fissidentatus TaxID=1538716 RepID=A0AAV5UNY8_9BILA|nr:hypothetical protein PFISCL1PPCAC_143 [Pristionchus fissidentatus]